MIFTSTTNERAKFQTAKANLMNTPGVSSAAVSNAQLTSSYLRSIAPVIAGQNTIQFQILSNQNNTGINIRPDERRLNQQDAFYCSGLMIYLFTAAANVYNYIPQTFVDPLVFTTANTDLYTMYNGYLNVNINQNLTVPFYPLLKFLNVPQTQQVAAAPAAQSQFDGSIIFPFEPNVVFPGTYQTTVTITMPAGIAIPGANVFAMLYCDGVLAQNVALGAV
jgi:hypothetical protein